MHRAQCESIINKVAAAGIDAVQDQSGRERAHLAVLLTLDKDFLVTKGFVRHVGKLILDSAGFRTWKWSGK
jgi:hypothetical protein